MPVRLRLSLGATFVVALILAIALITVHVRVTSLLSDSNRQLAEQDVVTYASEITANPDGLSDDSGAGVLVYVRDPTGTVRVDTMPHDIHEELEHRDGANDSWHTTADRHAVDYVVVARTVQASDGTWSVWAARSEAASGLAIAGLDRIFLIGALVLLASFALLSWRLAIAALRPVERMRSKAQELGASHATGSEPPQLPVGAANDELSELAITLNHFLARVRESSEREKQMVSDAAHELRTPLAALSIQLELAHDDFDDLAALRARVAAAEASVSRLSSLTSNLLELSRLESAAGPSPVTPAVELVDEMLGSIDRARLLALASGTEVSYTLTEPDPQALFGLSREGFGRVLDNLLANAIGAAGGTGSVEVVLGHVNGAIVLSVADDGPGMSEQFLPRAFDRFARSDDSRSLATGGTGLGLALVAAIVEAAHGTVTLRNQHPGLIATVTIPQM